MARRNGIVFLVILIIFILSVLVVFPIQNGVLGGRGMHLGLDLVGGVHLVYQVDFSANTTAADKSAATNRAVLVIQKRIETYGVTEPVIQALGNDRILIQLPGYTDIDAAKALVEQTGFLEFRVVERDNAGNAVYLSNYLSANITDYINSQYTGNRIFENQPTSPTETPHPVAFLTADASGLHFTDASGNPISTANLTQYGSSPSWVIARGDDGTPLTGALLSDAQPNTDPNTSRPVVDIKWNSEGAVIFNQIAARIYDPQGDNGPPNILHDLGIFLDNNLLSYPKVNESNYPNGTAVIEGNFTLQEATDLANLLKSGALPVQLQKPPLYQEKVSATLGAEFINMAWKAALIGLALVMLFMIVYYRLPGLLASLSLVFYGTLTLTILKLWPVPQITLTLAGLGGFIASIGMAVDANVLIFERMKEEFRTGRTLGAAIEAGFNRAWSAIRDSNITTFIACIILIIVGSSVIAGTPVKWFGVTLFIGVAVSMFTAITVTRTLLRLFIGSSLANNPRLFTSTGGKK